MKPEELERQFSAGECILARGAEKRELYVIRSGSVVADTEDGAEPRLLGAGAVFGEVGAVLGAPSPYRADAETEVTLLALDSDVLSHLCEQNGEFAVRLVRHLAEQLMGAAGAGRGVADRDGSLMHVYRKLVPVLFERCESDAPPGPVAGKLRELAEAADVPMLEAYLCIQRLLERRLLRLVEDQLGIIDPAALRELVAS